MRPSAIAAHPADHDLDLDLAEPHAAEAADPDCLDPSVAAGMLADRPWQRLVILGDSVASGVREPLDGYRDLSMADRVADALAATRPGFAWTNLAKPFLRAAEIRAQQLDAALAFRPDVVLVSAGGNDAFSRDYDARSLRRDLDALLRPLAEAGAVVAVVGLFDHARSGLLPPPVAGAMIQRFDELDVIQREVVTELGGIHVDGHHHPRGSDPALYSSDRIHCNARGHAVAAGLIIRALAG